MRNLIIVIVLFSITCYGQKDQKKDSSSIDYSLKFKVLENYNRKMDKSQLSYIDSIISKTNNIKIEKIDSKGFHNFDFYRVILKLDNFENVFIIGYQIDGGVFYRLKGFVNNDFYYLYKFETRILTNNPSNLLSKKNKKLFLKKHSISDIDLECLINHILDKENWKIPCLSPSQKIIIDDYGEEHW